MFIMWCWIVGLLGLGILIGAAIVLVLIFMVDRAAVYEFLNANW